jgi:small redox-active disulfide protein 2
MKQIKVLGSGCRNCSVTADAITQAADTAGVAIALDKVTDLAVIAAYGVMSTPGVVIDGRLVHAGGIPDPGKIRAWLQD